MNKRVQHLLLCGLLVCLLCAGVGAAVASMTRSGAARPLVRITQSPAPRTDRTEAEFRFKARTTATWCRRDAQRYRRCRRAVKYTGLRPGAHTFRIRARYRGRTSYVVRRWTVTKSGTTAAVAQRAPGLVAVPSAPAPDPVTGAVRPGARELIFADEFDGAALDPARWMVYDSPGHAGVGLRRPSAVAVEDGNLVITAKNVNGKVVSGGIAGKRDFTYGRVEFRVRTEADPTGTMSGVVLTWPDAQWSPEFTENDIYETGPRKNNHRQFDSFIHFGRADWQKWITHDVDPSQWRRVAMEWYPDHLDIYVDDQHAWSITDPPVIPDILHHVCIQLDARATSALTEPVRMLVDYIRVYR